MFGDAGHWRVIARANNLDNPLRLRPGQTLVIPPTTEG
jgi:nucleoid-associated protein YgaU